MTNIWELYQQNFLFTISTYTISPPTCNTSIIITTGNFYPGKNGSLLWLKWNRRIIIDILLVPYIRFSCSLIKWNKQRAKITITFLYPIISNWPINDFHVSKPNDDNFPSVNVYSTSIRIIRTSKLVFLGGGPFWWPLGPSPMFKNIRRQGYEDYNGIYQILLGIHQIIIYYFLYLKNIKKIIFAAPFISIYLNWTWVLSIN